LNNEIRTFIRINLIILIVCLIPYPIIAYDGNDIQWIAAKSNRLCWGDSFIANNNGNTYKVEAVDFISSDQLNAGDAPFVFIKIYKNDMLLLSSVIAIGNPEIYNNEIKVATIDMIRTGKRTSTDVYNPWALIEISFRGTPDFNIDITSDKKEYYIPTSKDYLTENIEIKVTLKNTGSADAKNIELTIDTDGLNVINGQKQISLSDLKKGESKDNILQLEIPTSLKDSQDSHSYKISATAQGEDLTHTKIFKAGKYEIIFKPRFSESDIIISKYISQSKKRISDETVVELIVRNAGSYNFNDLVISDSIHNAFKLLGNTDLNWKITKLGVGEEKKINYSIKLRDDIEPQKEFILPSAKASYIFNGKSFSITSNNPAISFELPPIKLTKELTNYRITPGSSVGVRVSIKNLAQNKLKVSVQDDLPPNSVLMNGINYAENYLNPGETQTINYEFRINTNGNINIPPATGKVKDVEGNDWDIQSKAPPSLLVAYNTPTPSSTLARQEVKTYSTKTPSPTYKKMEITQNGMIEKTDTSIILYIIAIFFLIGLLAVANELRK
jgi:hypothetical protein